MQHYIVSANNHISHISVFINICLFSITNNLCRKIVFNYFFLASITTYQKRHALINRNDYRNISAKFFNHIELGVDSIMLPFSLCALYNLTILLRCYLISKALWKQSKIVVYQTDSTIDIL